jgi:FkbM family methyltransferase
MAIYFDVGANDGTSTEKHVYQGHTVLAFEPNPEMYDILKGKSSLYLNWIVFPVAISDYEGTAEFNVCTTHDRGCSSLLEVSDAGKTQWGGRQDMIPNHKITVPVRRLDILLDWEKIPEIEFFHCDTQGSDLAVLKGMGQFIKRIKAGVVEAAAKPDILYVGQNYSQDTIKFLEENGFKVDGISPNDVNQNEVNISFSRL